LKEGEYKPLSAYLTGGKSIEEKKTILMKRYRE